MCKTYHHQGLESCEVKFKGSVETIGLFYVFCFLAASMLAPPDKIAEQELTNFFVHLIEFEESRNSGEKHLVKSNGQVSLVGSNKSGFHILIRRNVTL